MNKLRKGLIIGILTIIILFNFVNISFCQKSNVADYFFEVKYDGKRGVYVLYAGHGDMTPYFMPKSDIAKKNCPHAKLVNIAN